MIGVGLWARTASVIGLALVAGVATTGCGCSKGIASALSAPKPRDGTEPALLMLYLDDSASMDAYRKDYGEWAIRFLRSIKPDDPDKIGVHFATFRSEVTPKADLRLTGKSAIEAEIIRYEDAHPTADDPEGAKPDHRDKGTSLKAVLKDATLRMEDSKANTALIVIFCDGGVEDGPRGDLAGATAAAKALDRPVGGVKDLKVLMLGLTEDNNGVLIRKQEAFWSKMKVPHRLGKKVDTDAIIANEAPAFGAAAK